MSSENEKTSSAEDRRLGGAVLRQVIFALIVAASRLQSGIAFGWPAVLPKLQADNATGLQINDSDVQWLVSIMGIVGLACALTAGPAIESVGPRRFLIMMLLPSGVPFIMQVFTPYKSLFFLGRVITCVIKNVLSPLPALLISELTEPRYRALLLSVCAISIAIGQMFIYVLAHFLSWDVATALCAAPLFVVAFLTFLVPESPYWLVRHRKEAAAEKSLIKLRDLKDVSKELKEITHGIQDRQQITIMDQIKQLAEPHHYRPVLLLVVVFSLRECGGQYVIFSYTVFLFQKTGISLDAFVCTILVGTLRLIFSVIASVVVNHVGRRPLIITTTLVCGLAQIVAAIFLMVDLPGSSWVPLVAVLVFVSSYGLGLGPIPWALMGELIPTPVRSIGSSIVNFTYCLAQFLTSFIFPYQLDFGLGVAFILYASVHVILGVVIYFFLPETRGRSLGDLENAFKHDKQSC